MAEKNTEEEARVEGFGAYLQRQRELRGFSLEEIAEQTKISLRALRALEAEDWEILPADVYVRGFVRCYAEAIGLDPNEALVRYEKAVAPYRRQRDTFSTENKYVEPSKRRIPLCWILIGLIVILLIAGGYLFFKHSSRGGKELDFSTITTPELKGSSGGFEGGFAPENPAKGTVPSKP